MATNNLLLEFPPVSTQSWEETIAKDLKGADYAKKLVWQTDDGLAVKPYYRAQDIAELEFIDAAPGDFPYVRGTRSTGDWRIREEIDAVDIIEANHAACRAVVAGAEEIAFRNVRIRNAGDLAALLVNLQEIPVHFQDANEALIRLVIERLIEKKTSPALASTGFDALSNLEFAAKIIAIAPPTFSPFMIHGNEFEEMGATSVQEVGFTLASGINFLAEMQSRNIDVDRAAASITFYFTTGSNYFFEIAKLRAFRLVWARAVDCFGGTHESAKARIFARTSRWNETIYDPHVNVLRGTTEAMSAALGGADSISIAPFDECYAAPGEASRRLARNAQILLKQEALLSRVADPGGGSYCLEVITDFIGREGWAVMQSVEAAGGYRQAKADGRVQSALHQSRAAKEKAVASRRLTLTGTNQHVNLSERALDRINDSLVMDQRRGAKAYEQLRLRTERHAAGGGKNPRILLAEIGDVKMRSARSNFAANFFGCAGFQIETKRCDTVDEIAAHDVELIVLCSSDSEYPALAAGLVAQLKTLGRDVPVIVAGPPESIEKSKTSGVSDFIHVRSNLIEVLTKWQDQLAIKR